MITSIYLYITVSKISVNRIIMNSMLNMCLSDWLLALWKRGHELISWSLFGHYKTMTNRQLVEAGEISHYESSSPFIGHFQQPVSILSYKVLTRLTSQYTHSLKSELLATISAWSLSHFLLSLSIELWKNHSNTASHLA